MSRDMWVTREMVAAAKLKVKRRRARGLPIDPATEAIANARRAPRPDAESATGAAEGLGQQMWVTSGVVAAAKLKVKRRRARGLPIDPATEAIANARRAPRPDTESTTGAAESRTG